MIFLAWEPSKECPSLITASCSSNDVNDSLTKGEMYFFYHRQPKKKQQQKIHTSTRCLRVQFIRSPFFGFALFFSLWMLLLLAFFVFLLLYSFISWADWVNSKMFFVFLKRCRVFTCLGPYSSSEFQSFFPIHSTLLLLLFLYVFFLVLHVNYKLKHVLFFFTNVRPW